MHPEKSIQLRLWYKFTILYIFLKKHLDIIMNIFLLTFSASKIFFSKFVCNKLHIVIPDLLLFLFEFLKY